MTDEAALAEYENMVRHLARRAYSRFNGTRRAAMDLCDLQQAGRIGLLLAARTFDPKLGAFKSRAGFCIDRAILDAVRATFHRKRVNQISFVPLEEARYIATGGNVDTHIDVRRALAKLKRRQRTVLVSTFWDGRTGIETAEELGIPKSTVAWLKLDALRRLRAA